MYPANARQVELGGLRPGNRYSVSVMALNNIGESDYSGEDVILTTAGQIFKNATTRKIAHIDILLCTVNTYVGEGLENKHL